MQADSGGRYSVQKHFLSLQSVKKGSKKADKMFYGCEKVLKISRFGRVHYFQNSVIVRKEKKQKLMFNECFLSIKTRLNFTSNL